MHFLSPHLTEWLAICEEARAFERMLRSSRASPWMADARRQDLVALANLRRRQAELLNAAVIRELGSSFAPPPQQPRR